MGKLISIDEYLGIKDIDHLFVLDDPPDVFIDLLDESEIKALRANKMEQAEILSELAKKQIRPEKS